MNTALSRRVFLQNSALGAAALTSLTSRGAMAAPATNGLHFPAKAKRASTVMNLDEFLVK